MGASINLDFLKMFETDWHLLADFSDFFCGDCLGKGSARNVYEFRLNPKLVIKIDTTKDFHNVAEWDNYTNIVHFHPKMARWFAKPFNISSCGRVLLMERTELGLKLDSKLLPKEIPAFFMDFKVENWGILNGKAVCHDYANLRMFKEINTTLMKPKWWSINYQIQDGERSFL